MQFLLVLFPAAAAVANSGSTAELLSSHQACPDGYVDCTQSDGQGKMCITPIAARAVGICNDNAAIQQLPHCDYAISNNSALCVGTNALALSTHCGTDENLNNCEIFYDVYHILPSPPPPAPPAALGNPQHGFVPLEGLGYCSWNNANILTPSVDQYDLQLCVSEYESTFPYEQSLSSYQQFCSDSVNGRFDGLSLGEAARRCREHHGCQGFRHGTKISTGLTETRFYAVGPTERTGQNHTTVFESDFKCYRQVEGIGASGDDDASAWMIVALVLMVVLILVILFFTKVLTRVAHAFGRISKSDATGNLI